MAFSVPLDFDAVHCEGISAVTPGDIRFAAELGYRIKHLGIAKRREAGIELRVHPTLIPADSLLANVDGVLNAVCLHGDAAGQTVYSGAGAGRLPTASAVVADLVDIARQGAVHLPPLGVPVGALQALPVLAPAEVSCAWYLRLTAEDRPGVLSQLSNCLGAEGISIEALIQKPPRGGAKTVPLVVLTDGAREDALRRAVDAITALDVVVDSPHCIRCEELA